MESASGQIRIVRPLAALLIVVSLVVVYVIDKVTGLVPDVTVLYLAPIVAGVYFFGLWGGLITALGALAGVAAAHPTSHWPALAGDVAAHFGVFVFAVVVIDRLRRQLLRISALEAQRDYDLGLAREMQSQILCAPPQDPRFDIAYVLRYAREVGGDYYRFAPLDDGLFVCIADISGKALAAALYATVLDQSLAEGLARYDVLPRLIERLNRRLYRTMPPEMFVTMFCAVLDGHGMTWVNAGHLPPLLHHNGEVEELESDGMLPLGIESDLQAAAHEHPLVPGDILLTFTDGLSESRAAMSDPTLVPNLLERDAGAGPQRLVEELVGIAAPAGEEQRDDVAIVCVQVRG